MSKSSLSASEIKEALLASIRELLDKTNVQIPEITDETCPADLLGFDSQSWPYVMADLEGVLDITIPNDVNIFFKKSGQKQVKLKVREVVELLLSMHMKVKA